jgi:hypothetical protein
MSLLFVQDDKDHFFIKREAPEQRPLLVGSAYWLDGHYWFQGCMAITPDEASAIAHELHTRTRMRLVKGGIAHAD